MLFRSAIDDLEAPTYIIRTSPVQYSYAEVIFSGIWRVAVVSDDELHATEWQVERYDNGKLVDKFFNDGL